MTHKQKILNIRRKKFMDALKKEGKQSELLWRAEQELNKARREYRAWAEYCGVGK